jgi:hypothetical protein
VADSILHGLDVPTRALGRSSRALRLAALLGLLALLAAPGCRARTARFRPAESPGQDALTQVSAYYELQVEGRNWGDVKVWSQGAYPKAVDGRTPVIHVGLRLRNDSNGPMDLRLDRTNIEINTRDRQLLVVQEPIQTDGEMTVAPGSLERIALFYPLPEGLGAGDLLAFEVNWAVETGEVIHTHSTPFIREGNGRPYHYWRPGFYPYYGWHLSYPFGFRHHWYLFP